MPMSTAGNWNRPAGFTLIEIVLVLFLLGLFSALTLPMITGIGQDGLSASARRLAGTVKYLYNESVLNQQEYRLIFHLDQESYEVRLLKPDGELVEVKGIGASRRLQGEARFEDISVAGKGKFTSGEVTAVIHPQGWLPETVVHLDNGGGRKMTLRIMPFTGATEVYEGYREFEKQQ
jgi:prepilin-type N-terminal cleavage/methylation domain-containing protein